MSDAPAKQPRRPPSWAYVTRLLGVGMILYGVLVDHSGERGTIILTGAGIAGFDKVSRSEHKD